MRRLSTWISRSALKHEADGNGSQKNGTDLKLPGNYEDIYP